MKIWSVKCGAQITAYRGTEWALRDPLRSTNALARSRHRVQQSRAPIHPPQPVPS